MRVHAHASECGELGKCQTQADLCLTSSKNSRGLRIDYPLELWS